MRLLHVHSGNLFGGVETLLVTLARSDASSQLAHHFALCFNGRLAAELRTTGASVEALGEARARYPLTILRARQRLRALLERERFDAIACHMPWAVALGGPVVRASGAPLIFWMHDVATGGHWLEHWARRTPPDLALCNSRYTAASLGRIYPSAGSQVWYLPLEEFEVEAAASGRDAVRDELATARDAVVILQASRFEPWKGHRDHLTALAGLAENPDWVCWIAGGAQRPAEANFLRALQAEVEEAGIAKRVRFCGQRADLARLMKAADLYCQPNSGPEPFGMAFAEAMRASLPVVTTGLGGVAELVDETCGVIVPAGDPAALAEVLRRLIADASLRRRLGRAGRERVIAMCDARQQIAALARIVADLARDANRARRAS
jgi:glycosyltransferase involved in cell wall biosynthesis